MVDTSLSLLDRLRDAPDDDAWQRLVAIYTPLIRDWLRRQAQLPDADADDLVQEVMTVVVRRLSEFVHQQRVGSFRRWLRTITSNCLRDHWRSKRGKAVGTGNSDMLALLEQLADPESALSRMWDEEHDRHVTQHLLDSIQATVTSAQWAAFQRVVLDGRSPQETAAELGISVNAVFIAKSRVLSQLRQLGRGLLDGDT